MKVKYFLMVNKELALQIQKRALKAVAELDTIVRESRDQATEEDFEMVRRGVGLSIGAIQMELLEPLYLLHPEIDDLRE